MSSFLQNSLTLVGRVLISLLFIPAGLMKIAGFAGTVGYIASVGLPFPELGAGIAIVVEVIVGISFLLGFRTKESAFILAVFTFFATIFFHNYWVLPADQQMVPQLLFFKNMAVTGALLMLTVFGAGGWSLDEKLSEENSLN
jgi:putative oxidoreductase